MSFYRARPARGVLPADPERRVKMRQEVATVGETSTPCTPAEGSWSALVQVNDPTYTWFPDGEPFIVEHSSGRLHIVYDRREVLPGTDYQRVWHQYSDDGGSTWSDAVSISAVASVNDTQHHYLWRKQRVVIVDDVIYIGFRGDNSSSNSPQFLISDDNGASWTHTQPTLTNPWTAPSFGVDTSGVLYISVKLLADLTRCYVVTSTDGGSSWNAPVIAATNATSMNTEDVIAYGDDVILTTIESDGTYHFRFYYSSDSGASWTQRGRVDKPSSSGTRATVNQGNDLSLHIAAELNTGGVDYVGYSHSEDGGETWSAFTDVTGGSAKFPEIVIDHCNRIHVFTASYDGTGLGAVSHHYSDDGGVTLTEGNSLPVTAGQAAYPWPGDGCVTAGNDVYMVLIEADAGFDYQLYVTKIEGSPAQTVQASGEPLRRMKVKT